MTLADTYQMKTYKHLYAPLTSLENLELAYKKARKHKTTKYYVIEFEKNLEENLLQLRTELLLHSYKPKPLKTFIIRDPKTRKISKSNFRDRVIHHALINILEPIFESRFIADSYASRKGKGTLKAIKRFDNFKRKVSRNNQINGYVLKVDIKKYFENINHDILMKIIKKKIKDKKVLWLIKTILSNPTLRARESEGAKGMPLGNLTSQFFANVYLNELDYFVKNELKVKYYIRYVDDCVILYNSKKILKTYKSKINKFLKEKLNLELHPEKSKILKVSQSINFLGFRIFYYHKLLKKKNLRTFEKKLNFLCSNYNQRLINYDGIYDFLEGWFAYAKNASTYKLKKRILEPIEKKFNHEISTKEINKLTKLQKNFFPKH